MAVCAPLKLERRDTVNATQQADQLSPKERMVLAEELRLLMNVHDAIAKARGDALAARDTEDRAFTGLKELREQAGETSADDLPTVLLDMSVRHRLLERGGRYDLPDPASPYLAHLKLREGDVERDYCLGSLTFIESRANIRVVDWRVAPIAQVFYRYREGDAFEHELPGRVVEGEVVARRIVVIEKGELRRVVGSDVAIECDAAGVWRSLNRNALELSGGGAQSAARPGILGVGAGLKDRVGPADITALLDAEQYAAVSAPPEDALLVLGSAGSGKTTVALHRLARICAAQPHKYPLQHTKVVVPEEGLARLSRRLLAPLGAGSAQVQTLDAWAADLAQRIFEKELKIHYDAPGLVVSLKRHPSTYRAFRERFAKLEAERCNWQRLRRLIAEQLSNRDFLTRIVADAQGEISGRSIDAVIQHTMRQLADNPRRELSFITDPERLQALDGKAIYAGTPEELAGTVDIEDLPIMLFLRIWKAGTGGRQYSQLVLDEAEDFSLFELAAFGDLVGKKGSVTLAGDEAQQTASSFAGWETSLATISSRKVATCKLTTSYRCPRPIAELARKVLGPMAPQTPLLTARDGVPVGDFHYASMEQALLTCVDAVAELVEREPQASIAVIAADADAAKRCYDLMQNIPAARLVVSGDFSFEPGIDVTDVDNVKGLEFDYVVVPDATAAAYPLTNDARRRLHVAVTRASHQLWVVSGGMRTPILREHRGDG